MPKTVDHATPTFRLAFREEGDFVVCYFAKPDSMDEAIVLSSVRVTVLHKTPTFWEEWQRMMRGALDHALGVALGETTHGWTSQPAPEHERAGKA